MNTENNNTVTVTLAGMLNGDAITKKVQINAANRKHMSTAKETCDHKNWEDENGFVVTVDDVADISNLEARIKTKYIVEIEIDENYCWDGEINDAIGYPISSNDMREIGDKINFLASRQASIEAAAKLKLGFLYWSRGKRGVFYGIPQAINNDGTLAMLETDKKGKQKGEIPFKFYNAERLVLAKNQPV